jgi:L-alanine-DL-glutamate epimerase-like enolase superfamily enzyme
MHDLTSDNSVMRAAGGIADDAVITRLETFPLRIPLRAPFKISSGDARSAVEVVVVRLHTKSGLTGIGETQAWRRQGSSETLASLVEAIEQHFRPHVVGASAFDSARIRRALAETIWHSTYPQAAIADALLDLQGKLLEVPAYQLLGGKCRDAVPACAVLTIKPEVEETVETAARLQRDGWRTFAIKVGSDTSADLRLVRALRERLGDEAILRVDANASMAIDDALRLLEKIAPYDIEAAEQLIGLWDIDGLAELARRTSIPMLADESVSDEHSLIAIVRKHAAAAIQTKTAKNGGIWACRQLWTIAAAAGMKICPGNHPSTSIATAAIAHLATAWPGPILDGPFTVGLAGVIAEDVVRQPVALAGNSVRLTEAPGLGVELDDDRVRHLRVE